MTKQLYQPFQFIFIFISLFDWLLLEGIFKRRRRLESASLSIFGTESSFPSLSCTCLWISCSPLSNPMIISFSSHRPSLDSARCEILLGLSLTIMEGLPLSSRDILIRGLVKLICRPRRIISNLFHSVTPSRMFWPSFYRFCLSRLRRLLQFLVLNLLDNSYKFPWSHSDLLRFVCWLQTE